MCKQKDPIPMNCDVFCVSDELATLENISIAGNLYVSTNFAPFKAHNVFVEKDFFSDMSTFTADNIVVKGNLVFDKSSYLRFTSLNVLESCIIGQSFHGEEKKNTPIDCDVFIVNNFIPDNICITGNLYMENIELISDSADFDIGEDIFIDSSYIKTKNIKSQGSVYVCVKEKRAFCFQSLTALKGCKIFQKHTSKRFHQ